MADDANGNGNGRKAWLTKDTFVPVGSIVLALAAFSWLMGRLNTITEGMAAKEIADRDRAASIAEKLAIRDRDTDLALQRLGFVVEALKSDLAEVKTSVQELTHRGDK